MSDVQVGSPHYDRPPLVETVLGLQFDKLPGFTNAHLGAFWQSLDTEQWPTVADAPALDPQYERFTERDLWGRGLQVQLSQDCGMRVRITSWDAERMLQIQNGRIHLNWLGKGGAHYPRYERIRDEFLKSFNRFRGFLAAQGMTEVSANQWEITYVNHVPKATVWSTREDWSFFKLLAPSPMKSNLLHAESFNGQWHFVISDNKGRLHVEWKHARHLDSEERPEFISLTFTARGPLSSRAIADADILSAMDVGHIAIVSAFEKLMSDEAKQYWGAHYA